LARRISTPYLAPNPICKKINAPQNNYKPENALNASRIVFVPSLIPEGVLVHSNAMAGRSHAFRAVFCFPSAPESGGGSAREGKIELLTHMVNNAISFLLAESPQSGPFAV
jgi:hypothetical protein